MVGAHVRSRAGEGSEFDILNIVLPCGIAKKAGVVTAPMSTLDCRHVYVCIPSVIAAPDSSNLDAIIDNSGCDAVTQQ